MEMRSVSVARLAPGDVLLYYPDSFVGRLICRFDGSPYSHCSIYEGPRLVEAVGSGVTRREVSTSTAHRTVDIFRFKSSTGDVLGSATLPAQPILNSIDRYAMIGDRYAYETILLLAVVTTTRRIPLPRPLRWLVREIVDHAAELLSRIVALGKEPMICSELVYRCYAESGNLYVPRVVGAKPMMNGSILSSAMIGEEPARAPEADEQDLRSRAEAFLAQYASAKGRGEDLRALGVVPDFVTPRDLSTSPSLHCVGRLIP